MNAAVDEAIGRRDFDRALQLLRELIQAEPGNVAALNLLAAVQRRWAKLPTRPPRMPCRSGAMPISPKRSRISRWCFTASAKIRILRQRPKH